MTLNEFHEAIRARNAEVFANNHHTCETAALAVISEIGEMCNAVVGVMGCEQRKRHLTNDDVLDGIGDACVYLSVLADSYGLKDLQSAYDDAKPAISGLSKAEQATITAYGICRLIITMPEAADVVSDDLLAECFGRALRAMEALAARFGCRDFLGLLAKTFNHVSDRAGSKIRVTHD
jgi:hypothetical protein